MPRFYIVDPSLRDLRGHHFALSTAASRSALDAGFDVCWLCSRNVGAEFRSAYAEIRPTFGASMYENYALTKPSPAQATVRPFLSRVIGKLAAPPAPAPASEPAKVDQAAAFARDLAEAIAERSVGPGDRLLIHTADGATYLALARMLKDMPAATAPVFHVVTPYDPVGVMPNRDRADDVLEAVRAIRERGLVDRNVLFYGENELLASHLASLWSIPVRPLPLPAAAPERSEIAAAAAYRRDRLGVEDDAFLIVSLGSARIEKGFHLFPDIVRRTLEAAQAKPSSIMFALQASPQIIGRHPVIAAAIERLQADQGSSVRLLLEPLSEEEYRLLLLAGDAVMLPYQRKDYLYRSSGIVAEAIAAGKILIATDGSYPGAAALAAGGLVASTPLEFGAAAASAAAERPAFTAAAAAARDLFLAESSVTDYVPKLLRCEAAADRRPVVA